MKLPKILAGILLLLGIVLAISAWMIGRDTPRQGGQVPLPSASREIQSAKQAPGDASKIKQFVTVVAAQALAPGHKLTASDLKTVDLPESLAGSYRLPEEAIGKTTLLAIGPEQPVLENFLISGLSLQLENGQRAVSIAVKEAMAAGNHIRPGDFVDVFFTLQHDEKEIKAETQTRLLLARSRVLAYGPSTVENPPLSISQKQAEKNNEKSVLGGQRSSSREDSRGRAEVVNTAVLAIPLEDVQRITLAEKYGQLNLALRHPDDMAVPDLSLFAALPLALQPLGVQAAQRSSLSSADKAYAGLRLKDLTTGASTPSVNSRNSAWQPSIRRAAKGGVEKNSLETIELYSGSNIQTVSY